MSDLGAARTLLEHLIDRILPVFDRVVSRIPSDQLEFRASDANMTAAELGYHVYQLLYVLFRAVEQGRLYVDVLSEVPFDEEAVTHPDDILAYGERVRRYLRERAPALTEAQVTARVMGGGHTNDTGLKCIRLMLEEAVHHRGQLQVYLRLLGVEPPYLYGWPESDPS